MLRKSRDLHPFELRARDGRIGHVTDFFFDDRRWTIRYLVVDTGAWLDHREVLISPAAVHAADWSERAIPVDLTRAQVRNSPPVDADMPLSREQEAALASYYNWPAYWGSGGFVADPLLFAPSPFLPVAPVRPRALNAHSGSTLDEHHHIRSMEDVRGYRLEANDGPLGHVEDFLIDDDTWQINAFIVDTRNWWPGKRVVVAPAWVYEVGWDEAKVFIDLSREEIKDSPVFHPHEPTAVDYTDQLRVHQDEPRRNSEP